MILCAKISLFLSYHSSQIWNILYILTHIFCTFLFYHISSTFFLGCTVSIESSWLACLDEEGASEVKYPKVTRVTQTILYMHITWCAIFTRGTVKPDMLTPGSGLVQDPITPVCWPTGISNGVTTVLHYAIDIWQNLICYVEKYFLNENVFQIVNSLEILYTVIIVSHFVFVFL